MKKIRNISIIFLLLLLSACTTTKSTATVDAEKNKKVAQINIQLGSAYLAQGNIQRAKQKLLYAKEKAPELPEAWYNLAHFFEITGNKAQAEEYYLKSVELAPKRGDVLNNYGTFLCRAGKYQDAIQYFLTATKDPQYLETADAYENAGFCALKIPDRKQAIKYFSLALDSDPTRISSMNELSNLKI